MNNQASTEKIVLLIFHIFWKKPKIHSIDIMK